MANNQPTSASSSIDDSPKQQGIKDMYDSPEEDGEGQEGGEQPTFGDRVSNAGNNLSQDYQDVNTLTDNKLDDLVKDKANTLKDRYFPKKNNNEDSNEDGGQESPEDKDKDGQELDKDESQTDNNKTTDQSDQDTNSDNISKTERGSQTEPQDQPTKESPGEPAENPAIEKTGNLTNQAGGAGKSAGAGTNAASTAGSGAEAAGTAAESAGAAAEGVGAAAEGASAAVEAGAVAAEAGAVGAEAAAATAAGAPTGGIGAAVVVAGKAAIDGAKTAYKAFREGLKLKEKAEAAGRLFKRWWWCGCIVFVPLIILIGGFVFVYENILHLDTLSKIGKAIVSIFKHNRTTNNITFTDPRSADAIENGEMGKNAAYALSSIATGKKSTVTFKGISPITGKENEPYEFDVITYDTIKCALGTDKLPEITISLSPSFLWSSQLVPGKESAICSTDYFPGIDSVRNSTYSSLGPGEFTLRDIAMSGPKATKQKTMEVIDKIVAANVDGIAKDGQVPINKIILSTEIYNIISSQIISLLNASYPDKSPSEIIETKPSAEGIHFDFGI